MPKINVNGEEQEFEGDEISYDQAVALIGGSGPGYTVYVRGHADARRPNEVALAQGEKIALRHNAVINVSFTNTAPSA